MYKRKLKKYKRKSFERKIYKRKNCTKDKCTKEILPKRLKNQKKKLNENNTAGSFKITSCKTLKQKNIRGVKLEFKHKPVMLQECIQGLDIKQDGIYIDGTLRRSRA